MPANDRSKIEDIKQIMVSSPNGPRVPLEDLANIRVLEGPAQINRDMAKRRIVVGINVQGRDLGGYVAELQRTVNQKVPLPSGYFIQWGGQFQNMQRAMHHLMIIVPITIGAIFFLLFLLFHSVRFAALIITVLPLASIGGVFGLFITGEYLSVPASVGFIALWGIAVLNGVVLVSYIRKLRIEGHSQTEAIRHGTRLRFRPVMMTATVAALGLVPFLFARGPGSEIQRPVGDRGHWRPGQFDTSYADYRALPLRALRRQTAGHCGQGNGAPYPQLTRVADLRSCPGKSPGAPQR